MATLLVLGSKPAPVLPHFDKVDAVACANASGRSAHQLGLPTPAYTVMTSLLTSGKNPSNTLALRALHGLSTQTLFVYPRAPYRGRLWKRLRHVNQILRTTPQFVRWALWKAQFGYERILFPPVSYFFENVRELCGHGSEIDAILVNKAPSTGVVAIVLGLRDRQYDRVIVSGFSFEITHGYADNPDIARRGSTVSTHSGTDVAILSTLAARHDRLFTSEPIVHERTGITLLNGARQR